MHKFRLTILRASNSKIVTNAKIIRYNEISPLFASRYKMFSCLVFDDEDSNAAGKRRNWRKARGEAPSMPAMSQVLLKQPSACPTYKVSGKLIDSEQGCNNGPQLSKLF